ncbi:DUF3866 family protein [Ammoniphilus sp. YIM 78166]|uniref:DUF3866 family protein n=1 Tax=Ammoniphilus sp. YIM 78166 TaxID=1644106 RepID=UPI00106F7291|nr:DUF3866 family protein [Ammoniphilus sp. YIM 78166]
MIDTQNGKVLSILHEASDIQELVVEVQGEQSKAINYPGFTGFASVGDEVSLNTTAVNLKLGTGGYHFIVHILNKRQLPSEEVRGHIMKLRYTPLQLATGSCEEQGSPYHKLFCEQRSLEGMPVLVAELHSMLPIAVTYIKKINPALRVAYIMTDKAGLPISFSRHVRILKETGGLVGTITIGQAFGGDLEAVNIYTGLLAAKYILRADLVIVAMGPGIVGTGTTLGFSGMEQVEHLHAAYSLRGMPILVPRVGSADPRPRHQGISHHTLTVLEHTLVPAYIPILDEVVKDHPLKMGQSIWVIGSQHQLSGLESLLAQYPETITTMGRTVEEDPLFFYSVGLAADFASYITPRVSDPCGIEDLVRSWRDSTIL